MKRLAWFAILLMTLAACAKAQPPLRTPPPRVLEGVEEARQVSLERPVLFWRDGRQQPATEAVLLRVKVTDPFFFQPMGAEAPLFVYGDSVCERLQSPFPSGEAILLAPRQEGGAGVLWLTPIGMQPQEADLKAVSLHRPRAEREKRSLTVREQAGRPGPGQPRIRYRDLDELKADVLRKP